MHGGTGVTRLVLGAAAAIVRDGTESDKVVIIAAKKSHNKHSQSSLMTLSSRLRRKTSLAAPRSRRECLGWVRTAAAVVAVTAFGSLTRGQGSGQEAGQGDAGSRVTLDPSACTAAGTAVVSSITARGEIRLLMTQINIWGVKCYKREIR